MRLESAALRSAREEMQNHRITESQSHRNWKGPVEITVPKLLLKLFP